MFENIGNKMLSIGLVSVLLISSVACNSQNVLNDVKRFAPVVTNVLVAVCAFTANPLCATGAAIVQKDEQVVFKLWQDYINAQVAGTATSAMWNNLNAAFTTLVNDSADIFNLVTVIPGVDQPKIIGLVVAAQALLAVIESLFPASPNKTLRKAVLVKNLPAPNPKTGRYDKGWFNSWQKNWNSLPLVKEKHLEIYNHNKLVRVISFGTLN